MIENFDSPGLIQDDPNNERFNLDQCAKGDIIAFNKLFHKYYEQVLGLSLIMTKSPEMAKDLAQEIFTKIWENRQRLAEVREFRPYLNTVTRNHVRDFLKKRVFTIENESYLENYFLQSAGSADEFIISKQLELHLDEAVSQLPAQARKVFLLSRKEGLTHREIAARLKVSETTTKSHMVKALAAIRLYLQQFYPDLLFVLYITILFF